EPVPHLRCPSVGDMGKGQVQKGIQEGRQEGIQEGRQEGVRNSIARLLSKGLSPQEVAGLLDADPNLVLEIAADPQA
ncbi:MAG: hypothetical protein ACP5OS_06135, partial [Leptospirillia bacterium]